MGQHSSSLKHSPKDAPDCTDIRGGKFSHDWTIHIIGFPDDIMHSSAFSHPDDDKLKWRMELQSHYVIEINELGGAYGNITCRLNLRLLSGNQVSARFKFTLSDTQNKNVKEIEKIADFKPGADGHGFDFSQKEIGDDDLMVRCEVVVLPAFNVPECSLSSDLAQALHAQKYTDCVIEVEGQEIKAHKTLLSARSPVFAAMFEHGTQEAVTGRVVIVDIEFSVMDELVHFIYTGKAPNLSAMSERLMVAADKYQLQRLKVMCEASLWKSTNLGNVCETLVLADLHSATQLKDKTIKFINSNADHVTQTQGWKTMNQEQPHLLMDTFKAKGN